MQKKTSTQCPCGSGNAYDDCCGRYILGKKIPETAEALMRSRFTAYTQVNISYIQATMRGKAAQSYDPLEAAQWAKTAKWIRLKVLSSFAHKIDQDRYYVKFNAYYIWQGKPHQINETSEFQRIDGRWYYVDKL